MRRTTPIGIAAVVTALAAPLLLSAPAGAAMKQTVRIDDTRLITSDTGSATTSLAECPSAESVDVRFQVGGGPPHGVFVGLRDFQCADGGLVIRLSAKFGDDGSTGTWSVADSYGNLAGTTGTGTLVGDPIAGGGIVDHYVGTLTRR
jgi:hypothetical protein